MSSPTTRPEHRRFTQRVRSTNGTMITRPGPRSPTSRPKRNTTTRSYSRTTRTEVSTKSTRIPANARATINPDDTAPVCHRERLPPRSVRSRLPEPRRVRGRCRARRRTCHTRRGAAGQCVLAPQQTERRSDGPTFEPMTFVCRCAGLSGGQRGQVRNGTIIGTRRGGVRRSRRRQEGLRRRRCR